MENRMIAIEDLLFVHSYLAQDYADSQSMKVWRERKGKKEILVFF